MTTNQTRTDLDAVVAAIRGHERFLVTTHENPDGDALGSLLAMHLALERLGKDSVMYLLGPAPLPGEYRFLPLGELPYRWYADTDAATVAQKASTDSQAHGVWFGTDAGVQGKALIRVTGGAHRLRVEQVSKDSSWTLGRLSAEFEPAGDLK